MKSLIKQICVRTSIEVSDGEKVNQGSGILISNADNYFTITAYHCIYGENEEYTGFDITKIWIEYQVDYVSSFNRINIIEIVADNKDEDWIILKVEKPSIGVDFIKIRNGIKFVEEAVYFAGFQHMNPDSHRPFDGEIINIADKQFKIKLKGDTFNQGSQEGSDIAKGLSGSGVFIIRTDMVYLIGILKSVIGDIALNDDIECSPISFLDSVLQEKCIDLGEIAISGEWENITEKICTEVDIKNWVESNDDYFNHLLRKNRVLYPEEKAKEETRKRILKFLEQEYKNDQIRKSSNLINRYEETSKVFEESVKSDYTRDVTDREKAKDLLLKLELEFKEHIKDLIKDNSNKITLELAKHKVTEWLMNCSFDFKE
jgi:hypothetical protein